MKKFRQDISDMFWALVDDLNNPFIWIVLFLVLVILIAWAYG